MYAEILALIARAIAKNHGFIFPDNVDILRHESARAYLYTSDAEIALEVIDQYLAENEIDFEALEVANGYIMPAPAPVVAKAPKLDWINLRQMVDDTYKIWGVERAARSTLEQYEIDPINVIDDQFTHAQLIELYDELSAKAINPYYAPKTDKCKLTKAVFEMLNPYKGWLKIKLYFDGDYKCIGGEACDRWATYYQTSDRKITHEREIMIKAGYNPLHRALLDILQENTDEALKLDTTPPAPAPKPTPEAAPKSKTLKPKKEPARHGPKNADAKPAPELPIDFFEGCTRGQKNLYYQSFVGRENAFKEFLVVKAELEALTISNIKVGTMTASQSTSKSWNITGGENGKDKAALFWDANGWTIGPRSVDKELTGVFEDWDLSDHLSENDVYANGLHASQWYDAIDENAEAEALAAQQREIRAKSVSNFYNQH